MPKLYYSLHRASEPGSAEPWQIPGTQDKKAERVDVPAAPAELAAWLNSRRVPLAGDAFDGIVPGNPEARELLALARAEQPEGRFWELGPPTKEPPRVSPAFLSALRDQAEFVPVARSAAIAATFDACPKCQRTWLAQVTAGIADASIDELQTIASAIKQHVASVSSALDEQGSVQ